jgi:ssDNA-binding Zn-finger/Zn-ribbon topoisomerase 1
VTGIDVYCMRCGSSGAVNKVTAGLQCHCGSKNIVFDEAQAKAAALVPSPGDFSIFMTGQAAGTLVSGDSSGWNEYTGPPPSANTMSTGIPTPITCPTCHGSKFDIQDGTVCRACRGRGVITPSTEPEPPAVARHDYPSTQTKVPFMGRRKQAGRPSTDPLGSAEDHIRETTKGYGVAGDEDPRQWENSRAFRSYEPKPYEHKGTPLPLVGASCPNCGKSNTQLVQDKDENAWWHCPYCGPLANVDQKPHVDPYNPPGGFMPNGSKFKAASKLRRGKKTGRLMDQIRLIGQANSGLQVREVVGLARLALSRYPEAR